MTPPPLTTVRQPLDQMGAAASGMALELATTLIVRDSTAPPPPTV